MIVGTIGQEGLICHDYRQRPYGSQRISQLGFTERIPGGEASGMQPGDFDLDQLYAGTMVEMEHTISPLIAEEIAMDHLVEDPDYYYKLATIHLDGAGRLGADDIPGVFDIEGRAAAGARKAVKPMVVGSMILGAAGLLLGGLALAVAIRR